MTANLAARLRRHLESDHQRGCAGRQYACSCGYDATTEELLALAADALAQEPQEVQQGDWHDGYRDGLRDAKKIAETFTEGDK